MTVIPGLSLLILIMSTAVALPAQSGKAAVELTRKTLQEWVEVRRMISAEREAWRVGKPTLAAQIEVVRLEIKALNKRIDETKKSMEESKVKFGELDAERVARKATSESLVEGIAAIEKRALDVLPQLPKPLAQSVSARSQLLPRTTEQQAKLSLSERYQNVIAVLNVVDKWNSVVTLKSENRQLGTGQSVAVSVLYMGLGQAYYVGGMRKDGTATIGGVGTLGATGWQWREANSLAPAIQSAVEIYRAERLAALVRLPVQVR